LRALSVTGERFRCQEEVAGSLWTDTDASATPLTLRVMQNPAAAQ